MGAKLSRLVGQITWTHFVAAVLFVVTVGPIVQGDLPKGSEAYATITRLIALAAGIKLWFSQIPGATKTAKEIQGFLAVVKKVDVSPAPPIVDASPAPPVVIDVAPPSLPPASPQGKPPAA